VTAAKEGGTDDTFIVIIGSGSLAASNLGGLVSILQSRAGLPVAVVLTDKARRFVSSETIYYAGRALAVVTDRSEPLSNQPNHIWLATNAKAVLVYPASANFIGRSAGGLAGDLASITFLATHSRPRMLVPSMNPIMWSNPLVQKNVDILKSSGVSISPTDHGIAPDVTVIADLFTQFLNLGPSRK
jgi:phosphopantothenoylcysteine synthetase/decarboxylase